MRIDIILKPGANKDKIAFTSQGLNTSRDGPMSMPLRNRSKTR